MIRPYSLLVLLATLLVDRASRDHYRERRSLISTALPKYVSRRGT